MKKRNFLSYALAKRPYVLKKRWLFISLLYALLIIFPLLRPSTYLLRVATYIGTYTIFALSLNLLVGYTGLVSMGHAAFAAVGAYTAAYLMTQYHMNFFLAALIAIFCAGLGGLLLGLPTLRLSDTYFVIATLGFSQVIKVVTLNWKTITNGALGIKNISNPELFGCKLSYANGGLFYLMLIFVTLVFLLCGAIKKSKMGRALFAIKGDELAAAAMGIDVSREKVLIFTISAAIAGFAGAFYASMMTYIDPNTFSADVSTIMLSIVILGGMGSNPGMLLGAMLLISFPELLRNLQSYRFLAYGVILVVMMRFRPQGILGGKSRKPYIFPKGIIIPAEKGGDAE